MICISTNWLYKGRKIAFLIIISVLLSSPLQSQKNEIGLLVGGANYLGDISFHLSKTRPAFGIFFKNHYQNKFSYLFYLKKPFYSCR